MNATLPPLHHFNLGPEMSAEEKALNLRRIKSSDGLRAVLQILRDKAASIGFAGRQPPAGRDAGDFRAYHDGGEDALEESFRELFALSEAGEPEDEEAEAE